MLAEFIKQKKQFIVGATNRPAQVKDVFDQKLEIHQEVEEKYE